jgi:hypothetical protein
LSFAEVTGTAKSSVHEIISVPARWVLKMLTEEHKLKEWLFRLKFFTVTKMKENHLWKTFYGR